MHANPVQHFRTELTTVDGTQLFGQGWAPLDPPDAVVCLIHGLGEHSGRYAHLGEYLVNQGYALLTYDQRGHGRSPGKRGVIPSYEIMLDDIQALLNLAATRYPGTPRILYGHSLGGNMVLNFLLRRKPSLLGAIATGPMIRTGFEPPVWKLTFARWIERLLPSLALSNELNPGDLSRDPQVVSAYQEDPLVHDRLSVRLGLDLVRSGNWALEHAQELSTPLLLMYGEGDKIISRAACCEFAQRAEALCTLQAWPGLYHEIHNESEQEQVMKYAVDWIKKRLAAETE